MKSTSLISTTVDSSLIEDYIDDACLENEYWLLCYESIRHGWVPASFNKVVDTHPFFSLLKKHKVTFFQSDRIASSFIPKDKPTVTKANNAIKHINLEDISFISY